MSLISRFRLLLSGLLLAMLVSGCALLEMTGWAIYKVEVRVLDPAGRAVAAARLTTTGGMETHTADDGRAVLKYQTRGLHVVTISAPGWRTEQTKILVPQERRGVIDIVLQPRQQSGSETGGP